MPQAMFSSRAAWQKGWRDINASYGATVLCRNPARRTADPTADIEDCLAGLWFQQCDQLLCRCHATGVEMVEWL
jgi:hypothetical protein